MSKPESDDMTQRILQFGTSRFLQAHVDVFVHQARQSGQDIGPITVVKTTQGGPRAGRVDAFCNAQGFPVRLQGFRNGELIDETIQVKSIVRALDAHAQWALVKEIFAFETEIVISNVGETGYDFHFDDHAGPIPKSFPAKLHALLLHRYQTSAVGLTILPCELVSNNGQVLCKTINQIAQAAGAGDGFRTWLSDHVLFCDTLVDRIVSEAIEPIGAIGEPYGLWAIKRVAGLVEPLHHPCIIYTDDLEPFLRLKLHILNLGHTYLAHIWQHEQRPAQETVRAILQDTGNKQRLMQLYADEVIPGFSARNMELAAQNYVTATLARFENPFLNHRLSDIAQNHRTKIERRVIDFMAWAKLKNPTLKFPTLVALVQTQQI